MSVVPSSSVTSFSSGLDGLEDFDNEDVTMPTLRIEHTEATFKDGLSGQQFEEIDVIILGLIKQRVLWDAEIGEEKSSPLCRSYDFSAGHPGEAFPWPASGIDRPTVVTDETVLPCTNCKLKDWGSHPNRETPWCSSQYTFPLLRITEEGEFVPCLLTFQRSAIKPSNSYLSSFVNEQKPPYTVVTKLKLDARKRGNVKYAVPIFARGKATDETLWAGFADQYRSIRTFVQTPRTYNDENETDPVTGTVATPAPAATTAPPAETAPAPTTAAPTATPAPAPTPAPTTSAPADDDDIPF